MKGYRTLLVALGFVVLGVILFGMGEHQTAAALVAGGMSMAGMRVITNTDVGDDR